MADRRMVHKKIVESDSFYALSEGAQSMYIHLTAHADDDGFINNASSISSRIKNGKKKLEELVDKRFLLRFGDVYVIKHWRIGNSLKSDRTKPPTYPGIASRIWVKPNRAYTDHEVDGCITLLDMKTGIQADSKRIPSGLHLESQKKRTEQNRIEPNRTEQNRSENAGHADADFDLLWMEYPEDRRGMWSEAREAFRMEICSPEDFDKAMGNLMLWKNSEQWSKDGGQYVPYLCNWLTKSTWMTKPTKMAIPTGGSGILGEAELEAIRRVLSEAQINTDFDKEE